jgi:hypothetical protein
MHLEKMLLGVFLFLQVFLQQTPRDSLQAWQDVMSLGLFIPSTPANEQTRLA